MKLIDKFKLFKPTLRFRWGIYFFVFAITTFIIFLTFPHSSMISLLWQNFPKILWCATFSFFGIGVGLINSRERKEKKGDLNYLLCFGFVSLISTIAALVTLLNIQNLPAAYASSALIGIIAGFSGDALTGKILDLIPK